VRFALETVIYFTLILAVAKPIGVYMARLFTREKTYAVERAIYRLAGVDETTEQSWSGYTIAMLVFSAVTLVLTYAVERLQNILPLNPDRLRGVAPDLAWNTAMSFTTNTNWQAYSGESTMSHLTQMAGLTLHNFVSAAVGIVLAVAIIRAVARASAPTIGNFWVDLTRCTLWLLLPVCIASAIVFASQGVIQNFNAARQVTTLEGKTQKIPQGPVASQEAIKELGTNGGGFFNANSAHPYENPTPFTNLFEMFLIFVISAGLPITLGMMTGKPRHGWAVFWAMAILFLAAAFVCVYAERNGNPIHHLAGGNMEGKEVRFGIGDSALFATVTTDASCGAVNAMHDSFTPIGGSIPLLNIMLGEIVFGGTGAGLYGMFLFIVLSVFIAGLMVGRTPEYLGKKIEAHDVKLAMLAVLVLAFSILAGTAAAAVTKAGVASLGNAGPHGLSEMTYAFTSATGNNGSAFAGLNANTKFYNVALGLADVRRPLPDDHPADGNRRLAGGQEEGRRIGGDVPGRRAAVHVPPDRRDRDRRRSHLFPGPLARPVRRALPDERGEGVLMSKSKKVSLFDRAILRRALADSFLKLSPRRMMKNPVMFLVEAGAVLTTILLFRAADLLFQTQIAFWLWATVLFANFAEAVAEGRGKAQADALRKAKTDAVARKLAGGKEERVPASALRKGDVVVVEANDIIPGDGTVIEGIASVNESAITGESAPVIREAGGDRSAVTGGTMVLSDRIVVEITSNPGQTFLDRMIKLVEGAERQKTPNEIALDILLAGLTIVFLLATVTLKPFAVYSGSDVSVTILVALLVCLIPTTIGALLSAIGIAGMDRVLQHNILAMSGRAVEASGDVNVLLLDKTGTITLGNRQAHELIAAPGIEPQLLAEIAQLSSLADETPEGRSIVVLAKERFGLRGREMHDLGATFVPFTARTRMSGLDFASGRAIRKGAADAVDAFVRARGGAFPDGVRDAVARIGGEGGTPLVVADNERVIGTIHLKDIVKGGMKDRFDRLRMMGIRTVMITGDNPLTAATIAREAGVDDFLAEATPEDSWRSFARNRRKETSLP
jgi:K+-transporting ATPase B subunit/K+-transporting ATPase KdpA subunit